MREELLAFVSNRGTLLEPDAIEFLLTQRDPVERLEAFLGSCLETPFVVTLDDVMRAGHTARNAAKISTRTAPPTNLADAFTPASFRRLGEKAADHDPDVRILRDITGHSTCEGTLADFTRYFRHRFQVLRNMLRSRHDLAGAQEIAKARRSTREVRIIGIVADVRTTKNGHRILEIEDEADRIAVLLPSESAVASEIAVLDGIGVYPRQDEELVIDDIYGQYEALARMVADLPDRVSVIMLPGNHDAVRPAEPQPAFPTSIQNLFDSNVIFAGNPSLLSVEGVRILAYHGRSMDDLVSAIPGMSYARPLEAMKAMLRMRHLAPIYGGKTPIAPEAEDHLIIEEIPDIFATGHVHAAGVDQYRGVVLVNSSTWQAQTPYQKLRNIEPMPARLPIVDLASGQAIVREF